MSDGPTFNVANYGTHGQAIGQQNIHIGSQPRTLKSRDATASVAAAQQYKGTKVDLTCLMGDGEGIAFAHELKALLEDAGWQVEGVNQAVFSGPVEGIVLRCQGAEPAAWLTAVGNAILGSGIKASGQYNSDLDGIIIRRMV
jgi:hypothetical protein